MDRESFDILNMDYSEVDPEYGGRAQSKGIIIAPKTFAPKAIVQIPPSTIDRAW